MKLSPLRVVLLCMASGFGSGLVIPLLPNSSEIGNFIPGLFFGVFLLIWLPSIQKLSALRRMGSVLASAAIYYAAVRLAIKVMDYRIKWLAYFLAGMLGATLLLLMLRWLGKTKLLFRGLPVTALLGGVLGLPFMLRVPSMPELAGNLVFSSYFVIWQAGMGLWFFHMLSPKASLKA